MAGSDPVSPGRIFISYRRAQAPYATGWLYERLVSHFGPEDIVRDIDSIEPGDDFVKIIDRAVASCDVMLVLIGTGWITVTDDDGRRRLDRPDDFVRREIEAALQRDIRVIPILVDGATMPRNEELPSSLVKLTRRQALELSPHRFSYDTERLVRVLDKTISEEKNKRNSDEQDHGTAHSSDRFLSDEGSSGDQGETTSLLLSNRFELGGLLGRGEMAEVRRAADIRLGRPVAVKQLRGDLTSDPTFQTRFRREAQSAAGLNHPNIVGVYDTGERTDSQTGISSPYIVMELVEGVTLRDVLRDRRKIVPERALELVQGVLNALDYIHKAGIIHGNIEPANVMLTQAAEVKVMGFGSVRALADTRTDPVAMITVGYLSPEQAVGKTIDARSDIYSTGCLLYELLVGRPPFVGESPVSVAYQHVREVPVAPSLLDSVLTPDIDAITLKALEKNPVDRYQSAREMNADIARVLSGQRPEGH